MSEENREWFLTKEKLPNRDDKILAIGYLPSGQEVMFNGSIDTDWFIHFSGGLSSLSSIIKWSYATEDEIEKFWDESNFYG